MTIELIHSTVTVSLNDHLCSVAIINVKGKYKNSTDCRMRLKGKMKKRSKKGRNENDVLGIPF